MKNWNLRDSYQILKALENQELINAMTKDAKYVHETNKFIMSNDQILEIHWEIDCHLVNHIYYLKYKLCNEKETYIDKTLGDNTKGFKVTINQHIFDCETEISACKFPLDVFIVVLRIIVYKSHFLV